MFPWFKASKPVASQPSLAQMQTSDDVDSVQQDFDGLPEAKPSPSKPRSWAYSDEEIAQWREERRKQYPSAANQAKKAAEQRLKAKRNAVAVDESYRWSSSDKTMRATAPQQLNPIASMVADYGSSSEESDEDNTKPTAESKGKTSLHLRFTFPPSTNSGKTLLLSSQARNRLQCPHQHSNNPILDRKASRARLGSLGSTPVSPPKRRLFSRCCLLMKSAKSATSFCSVSDLCVRETTFKLESPMCGGLWS
eukprot:m.24077 g.24077  ORF g.24077 m.24077 type:complete len:251 (+) comp11471_c0_seq1:22-774(+)